MTQSTVIPALFRPKPLVGLIASFSLTMFVWSAEPAVPAVYRFDFQKPADAIAVSDEGASKVFLVTSSSGIGSVKIRLVSGAWPKNILLRFQYETGRGFRSMEGFALNTARWQIAGGSYSSGKMEGRLRDADGKVNPDHAAQLLNIVMARRDKSIDVILPENFCEGSTEIEVRWIDAYR